MNRLITIATFLFCFLLPTNTFGMKLFNPKYQLKFKIPEKQPLKTYTELINALIKKETVATSDFINCIEDAKKHNFKIFFISDDLIESSDLKNQIADLFQKSTNHSILFQAYKIPKGFICLFSTNLIKTKNNNPSLLTTESELVTGEEALLKKFNIPLNINKEAPVISRITTQQHEILKMLFDRVSTKVEQVKEIEEKEEETKTPTNVQEESLTKKIIEQEESEQPHKEQAAIAKKYESITEQIKNLGIIIPQQDSSKASIYITILKEKPNITPETKEKMTTFFAHLEEKIKSAEREKLEEEKITRADKEEHEAELKKAPQQQKPLIQKINTEIPLTMDIYTIPLD